MAQGGELVIKIKGDASEFEKELSNVEKIAKAAAAQLAQEYKKAGTDMSTAMKRAFEEVKTAQKNGTSGTIDGVETIISKNEDIIDFTNTALTDFLIKLSVDVEQSDETVIGSYFHVLNDLERIGDHAENFFGIVEDMSRKKLSFSAQAQEKIRKMYDKVTEMFSVSRESILPL